MAFLWRHGGLALRDCDDCQKYVFNADGTLYRDKSGRPIPVRRSPVCARQACGSRDAKPRLEEWHADVLELWRACHSYQQLPRAGGIVDQDWFVMRLFLALDALRAEVDAEKLEEYIRTHGGKNK